MNPAKRRHPNADAPVLWNALIWIIAVHLLGAFGIWYLWFNLHAATVVLAVCMFVLVHLSISAGLHRLYSHKASTCVHPTQPAWGRFRETLNFGFFNNIGRERKVCFGARECGSGHSLQRPSKKQA
jgi:hypothetical protein